MIRNYFTNNQSVFLLSGLACFLASLVFSLKGKEKLSLIFLILTAVSVYCFAALLDPFLNIWDERFHALVAKNLAHHPLRPTLYDDPVVNMAYDRWDRYHIWVHKQPLFLWQIALSFRLFGVSEFTLRLPSVILGVVLVFISYRSGKLLVNKRTGYLAGLLFISSFYLIEHVSGRQNVDHNDFSFLAYVSLSIWSFIEYHYSKKKFWIYLIGLFSGCAILCKWLTGLLVYSGWMVLKLKERKRRPAEYKDMLISALVTLIIVLPWQIYILNYYPAEARLAYQFNVRHIFEALDGHSGTFWYHFSEFDNLYGSLSSFLIIPAFVVFYRKITDRKIFLPLILMVAAVYLFFSLVQTKMPSFPLIVAMLIYIPLASLVDSGLDYLSNSNIRRWIIKPLIGLIIVIIFISRIDVQNIKAVHTLWKEDNSYSRMLIYNKSVFQSLKLPGNTVIFNVKGRHYIESMFYTGLPSYGFVPSMEQCQDLKGKGKVIAIFRPQNGELPGYLADDKSVIIINEILQGYD